MAIPNLLTAKGRAHWHPSCDLYPELFVAEHRYMSGARGKAAFCILLGNLVFAGCARNPAEQADEPEAGKDQQPPFERISALDGFSPTATLVPTTIPAGTPVTVHLRSSISSARSHVGDSFTAILDEPIIVRGQTLAPRGAVLSGKVLEARASSASQSGGYLRLALSQISLGSKSIPMRTSSVFIKASQLRNKPPSRYRATSMSAGGAGLGTSEPQEPSVAVGMGNAEDKDIRVSRQDIQFPTEKALTFRLVENVPFSR